MSVRSMNIDNRPTTDLGQFAHFGKFYMVITLQRIVRSPTCFFLGWGFWGRQIEQHYFWLDQIQDGGRRSF